MKKLIIIFFTVIILAMLFLSMMESGYSWQQAAGFDLVMLIMWLAIIGLNSLNCARRELTRKDDNFYDA